MPVLISSQNTLIVSHTLCCKTRTDPLHFRLVKAEPVAWHHLDQPSSLFPSGKQDMTSSFPLARHGWQLAVVAHSSASPGWSNQSTAGRHSQVSAKFLYTLNTLARPQTQPQSAAGRGELINNSQTHQQGNTPLLSTGDRAQHCFPSISAQQLSRSTLSLAVFNPVPEGSILCHFCGVIILSVI